MEEVILKNNYQLSEMVLRLKFLPDQQREFFQKVTRKPVYLVIVWRKLWVFLAGLIGIGKRGDLPFLLGPLISYVSNLLFDYQRKKR